MEELRLRVEETVARYREEIIQVMQALVRIPSENTPPTGAELACQEYIAGYLRDLGLEIDVYTPDEVPELSTHPDYWPGRIYTNRPNVSTTLRGSGDGRSLLLTGHSDTVPLFADDVWTVDPFGGIVKEGRLYGLGAVDMKGAMGAMLVLMKALVETGIRLQGDLTYECVVDEEVAGVNGTIAGRLRGGAVDAAIIPEVSGLDIYPAARGARLLHIFLEAPSAFLQLGRGGRETSAVVEQIRHLLEGLADFSRSRRSHPVPPLYEDFADPVPVLVSKIYAGGWGFDVPTSIPGRGRLELLWQTMPGETLEDLDREFKAWLEERIAAAPDLFAVPPRLEFPMRWMPGTQMAADHELVTTLRECVQQVINRESQVTGAPYPCDLWALQRTFNIPSVVFGPGGGNAHTGDEYVNLDETFEFVKSLLLFIMTWCGA